MDKIIKDILQYCKSRFISWILEKIWKIFPFGEGFSIMLILAQIQSIPSFYWIPTILLTCYLLILVLNTIDKRKKSPFEILTGTYNSCLSELTTCNSCKVLISNTLPYTVGIRNNGKKTIEQVSVMFNDRYSVHEESNTKYCDLHPQAVGYFVFNRTQDQKQIEVTVIGKDTLSLKKILFL